LPLRLCINEPSSDSLFDIVLDKIELGNVTEKSDMTLWPERRILHKW